MEKIAERLQKSLHAIILQSKRAQCRCGWESFLPILFLRTWWRTMGVLVVFFQVVAGAVASFLVGMVWFSPVTFGRIWWRYQFPGKRFGEVEKCRWAECLQSNSKSTMKHHDGTAITLFFFSFTAVATPFTAPQLPWWSKVQSSPSLLTLYSLPWTPLS